MTHPPLAPLRALLARLERDALPHALGGSGLLAAIGLVDRVADWDVMVDAPVERVRAACAGASYTELGPSAGHADHLLRFEDAGVELIARLAYPAPAGVVRIPFAVSGRWNDVPLASPTAWAVAYALLAQLDHPERRARRAARADALFEWLAARPPEREVLARLRAEPLPADIARRLPAG